MGEQDYVRTLRGLARGEAAKGDLVGALEAGAAALERRCATCRFYNVDRMLGCCENIDAPCYNNPAPPDFGCTLYAADIEK